MVAHNTCCGQSREITRDVGTFFSFPSIVICPLGRAEKRSGMQDGRDPRSRTRPRCRLPRGFAPNKKLKNTPLPTTRVVGSTHIPGQFPLLPTTRVVGSTHNTCCGQPRRREKWEKSDHIPGVASARGELAKQRDAGSEIRATSSRNAIMSWSALHTPLCEGVKRAEPHWWDL